MNFRDCVVIDRDIRFGKPCVRGTRIAVGDVLSYLASGMTEAQIMADFPQLTRDDIRACLTFAAARERSVVAQSEASCWMARRLSLHCDDWAQES